ncbi:MAG TPA: hypothetical protein VN618_02700 [Solirubrobacteraceae bacterium]|nr:hypothetical protein [Solirubrobacteraceae bacterium]
MTSAVPGGGRAPAVGRVLHDVAAPALAAVRSVPVPTLPGGGTLPAVGATLLGAAGGVAEGLLSGVTAGRAAGVLGTPVEGPWEPPLGLAATFSPAGAIASLAGAGAVDTGVAGSVSALSSEDPTAARGVAAQTGTGAASARAGRQRAAIEGAALGTRADPARAGGVGRASRGSELTHRSPLVPVEPGSGVAPTLAGAAAAGIAGIAIALMALVSTRPPGRLRRLLAGVPRGPSEPFALLLSRPG